MSSLDILRYQHSDSLTLLESYVSGADGRIRYVFGLPVEVDCSHSEMGVVEAMRKLLAASESDYVVFCDEDTLSFPFGLEKLLAFLECHPECGGAYGLNYGYRQSSGNISYARGGRLELFSLFESHPVGPGAMVIRRCLINEVGGVVRLDPYGDFGWDTFLDFRLAIKSPLVFIPQPVSASVCRQQILDFYNFSRKNSINALLACGEKLVTRRLRSWFMGEYKSVLDAIQSGKLNVDNPRVAIVALGFLAHMPEISSRNLEVIIKTAMRLTGNDFSLIEFVIRKMIEEKKYIDAGKELERALARFADDPFCCMLLMALKKTVLARTAQVLTDTDEYFNEVREQLQARSDFYVPDREKRRIEKWIKENIGTQNGGVGHE